MLDGGSNQASRLEVNRHFQAVGNADCHIEG
jgi:hypothetical protein